MATIQLAIKRQSWSLKELAQVLYCTMIVAHSWAATREVLQLCKPAAAVLQMMVFRRQDGAGRCMLRAPG